MSDIEFGPGNGATLDTFFEAAMKDYGNEQEVELPKEEVGVDGKVGAPAEVEENQEVSEENSEEVEEDKEDAESEEGAETSDEEQEESSEEDAETIKMFEAQHGEDILEIPLDTKFKHKADGKEVEWTLQELLNHKSGEVALDRRFSDLDKNKKEFEAQSSEFKKQETAVKTDIKNFQNFVMGFAKKVDEGDLLGAVAALAEASGKNPKEFRQQMIESSLTLAQKYATMSPEERRLEEVRSEIEWFESQQQSALEKQKLEQANHALESELRKVQETHNIDDAGVVSLVQELKATGVTDDKITPQLLDAYVVSKSAYDRVDGLLASIDPKHVDNDTLVDAVAKLVIDNKEVGDDELKTFISKVFHIRLPKSPEKQLKEKVQSTKTKKISPKKGGKPSLKDIFGKDNIHTLDDLI